MQDLLINNTMNRFAILTVAVFFLSFPLFASVKIGTEIVGSHDLGYKSPYLGVVAVVDAKSESWLTSFDSGFYDANKGESGGFGYRAGALVGHKINDSLSALVGVRTLGQYTPEWRKISIKPEVEIRFNRGGYELRMAVSDLNERAGRTVGISALTNTNPQMRLRAEETWYGSNYSQRGTRVAFSALWRIR